MEDHESLETGAVIGEFADAVKHQIDDFFADGVVTTSIVVGSIFLARDKLLRMIKLAVGTGTDFIAHSRFQINKHSTRYMFTRTSFRKKRVEGIITTTNGFVGRHLTIRLDAVLQAIKFPACLRKSLILIQGREIIKKGSRSSFTSRSHSFRFRKNNAEKKTHVAALDASLTDVDRKTFTHF